jgi:hypothetical protein
MAKLKRISIFVLHDDDATDFEWVQAWIIKWKNKFELTVAHYSSGGWEHLWDIEASEQAIAEVPENYLCDSEWATTEIFKPKNKTNK